MMDQLLAFWTGTSIATSMMALKFSRKGMAAAALIEAIVVGACWAGVSL